MIQIKNISDHNINVSAQIADVDRAVKLLQDIAGIETGDIAGVAIDRVAWAAATPTDRVGMIVKWLALEDLYARAPWMIPDPAAVAAAINV